MVGNILTPTHLALVLVVALLVLGPKRLPAAGRGLGEAMRDFKEALTSEKRSDTPDPRIAEDHRITGTTDAAPGATTSLEGSHPTTLSLSDAAASAESASPREGTETTPT
jgi:sec-independent protein translocase protein TatA